MDGQYSIGLSKQAVSVYKLLIGNGPLSAKEIGERMGITPHSVYRLIRHLGKSGLVEQIESYPLKYQAKRVSEGMDSYLSRQRSWFFDLFMGSMLQEGGQGVEGDKPFAISFFQNRDEHLELLTNDINKAKFSAKYIVLVLPIGIPSELLYTQMNAVKRGVEFKILALESTKENFNVLMSYKHIGVQVKLGKFLGWHLNLIDNDISHISMFDPKNKALQSGVRLVHQGINRELQGIFERYWSEAEAV